MRKPISWHEYWMRLALLTAERSKDPKTQVGCVIVRPDNRDDAKGYNGFATGVKETPERWQREGYPNKYQLCIHAEENALLNATSDVRGWTAYVTCRPCERCASKLVQAGIKKVIYLDETKSADYELSDLILGEGGVELERYEEEL